MESVKKEAKVQNEKLFKKMIERLSKLEIMKSEIYEERKYLTEMSMHDYRIIFKIRSRMCKMNFLNDPTYKSEMLQCGSCATCIDIKLSHILYFPAYKMLREGKSLTSDQDIVKYFKEFMKIRTKINIDK